MQIRNKKDITINTTEIQMVIRKYYAQLYANELKRIQEIDKLLYKKIYQGWIMKKHEVQTNQNE
jgi:hypothetical protein